MIPSRTVTGMRTTSAMGPSASPINSETPIARPLAIGRDGHMRANLVYQPWRDAVDLRQLVDRGERPIGFPVIHDASSQDLADARKLVQLPDGRRIEVDKITGDLSL